MSVDIKETVTTKYEVTFGPKKESDREKKQFSEQDKAIAFFKEKDKAGMYVSAYEIQTTITKKSLA